FERRNWLSHGADWQGFGKPAYAYPSGRAYEAASYSEPSTLLASLARAYGEERLLGALSLYAKRYRFRHPTADGLIATLSEGLRDDVSPLFRQAMQDREWDYEVASLVSRREEAGQAWRSEVVVHRKGAFVHPVEIQIERADGTKKLERWD